MSGPDKVLEAYLETQRELQREPASAFHLQLVQRAHEVSADLEREISRTREQVVDQRNRIYVGTVTALERDPSRAARRAELRGLASEVAQKIESGSTSALREQLTVDLLAEREPVEKRLSTAELRYVVEQLGGPDVFFSKLSEQLKGFDAPLIYQLMRRTYGVTHLDFDRAALAAAVESYETAMGWRSAARAVSGFIRATASAVLGVIPALNEEIDRAANSLADAGYVIPATVLKSAADLFVPQSNAEVLLSLVPVGRVAAVLRVAATSLLRRAPRLQRLGRRLLAVLNADLSPSLLSVARKSEAGDARAMATLLNVERKVEDKLANVKVMSELERRKLAREMREEVYSTIGEPSEKLVQAVDRGIERVRGIPEVGSLNARWLEPEALERLERARPFERKELLLESRDPVVIAAVNRFASADGLFKPLGAALVGNANQKQGARFHLRVALQVVPDGTPIEMVRFEVPSVRGQAFAKEVSKLQPPILKRRVDLKVGNTEFEIKSVKKIRSDIVLGKAGGPPGELEKDVLLALGTGQEALEGLSRRKWVFDAEELERVPASEAELEAARVKIVDRLTTYLLEGTRKRDSPLFGKWKMEGALRRRVDSMVILVPPRTLKKVSLRELEQRADGLDVARSLVQDALEIRDSDPERCALYVLAAERIKSREPDQGAVLGIDAVQPEFRPTLDATLRSFMRAVRSELDGGERTVSFEQLAPDVDALLRSAVSQLKLPEGTTVLALREAADRTRATLKIKPQTIEEYARRTAQLEDLVQKAELLETATELLAADWLRDQLGAIRTQLGKVEWDQLQERLRRRHEFRRWLDDRMLVALARVGLER